MWPFKSKYEKIKRTDVVSAIMELESQEKLLENGAAAKQDEIEELLEKGKAETDRSMKLFYAKKINHLKAQRESDLQRAMYLLYNIRLMNKLKDAIDDKEFVSNVGKMPLNNLLRDPKGLASFLNKALNRKIAAEDIMTEADNVFNEVASMYAPNEEIYGASKNDDQLLAMFETEEMLSDDFVGRDKKQSGLTDKY